MKGEPGFFGSYGFEGWAGAGEAKPIGVMHELGHSYWGGFPVPGRPELDWKRPAGENVSSAMASYHRDVLAFMAQPPDDYELWRERLRNLPGVSVRNPEPLFHSLEADVPYATGGDLSLLPPVLRKYWGLFLADGPFGSWERAAGWFLALTPDERRTAGKFLGFEHFELRPYPDLPAFSPSDDFLSARAGILAAEERQRLTDLAAQFDLLIGDAQLEENFQFWRGYLQDKVALHRDHPGHLESLSLPRARQLADALQFLVDMEGGPEARSRTLAEGLVAQPFLVNFLPAVDDRTLVHLFAGGVHPPEGPTLQATASFVQRLQRFGSLVEQVLADGKRSPAEGAQSLEQFLADTGLENEQDLRLFFDLFNGADHALARGIMEELDEETIRALIVPVPVQLRGILGPETLLDRLGITTDASGDDLKRGIRLLIGEASGNYRIDEPFLDRLYDIMARRAEESPADVARVMSETPLPLEGMILRQPAAVSAALSGSPDLAASLVQGGDPVLSSPARMIYRIAYTDPMLAAKLVIALDERDDLETVTESLAYLAYDKQRSQDFPSLPISLENDGEFLLDLLQLKGADWLESRLSSAVSLYRERAQGADVSPDFLVQYRATLDAAAAYLGASEREELSTIFRAAFEH